MNQRVHLLFFTSAAIAGLVGLSFILLLHHLAPGMRYGMGTFWCGLGVLWLCFGLVYRRKSKATRSDE
jgi:hypothetical protein